MSFIPRIVKNKKLPVQVRKMLKQVQGYERVSVQREYSVMAFLVRIRVHYGVYSGLTQMLSD